LPKLQKVVPKGAQRKFSAQKSFQRECRAKYRRNIRRRSSKDVPKRMQNLYRRNRRQRSSKDVPKGMQNLHQKISGEHRKINGEESSKVVPKGMQSLCVPVWAYGCVSSASSSFCIISFRITSHHASYHINGTRIEYRTDLRRMLRKNKNVLRHEVSFGEYNFISLVTKEGIFFFTKHGYFYEAWIFFFTKHEKKGRCFFVEGSKTVCM
jgi:hypothetical protein